MVLSERKTNRQTCRKACNEYRGGCEKPWIDVPAICSDGNIIQIGAKCTQGTRILEREANRQTYRTACNQCQYACEEPWIDVPATYSDEKIIQIRAKCTPEARILERGTNRQTCRTACNKYQHACEKPCTPGARIFERGANRQTCRTACKQYQYAAFCFFIKPPKCFVPHPWPCMCGVPTWPRVGMACLGGFGPSGDASLDLLNTFFWSPVFH